MSLDADTSPEARMSAFFGGGEPATEPEQAQPQDQADDQPEAVEATETESEAVEEVVEEEAPLIELDGRKLTAEEVKAELSKAQDYTRKTQTLAEEKRLFETQQRLQQEHAAFQQHVASEVEQLRQIDSQLEAYRRVDLSTADPADLSRMSMIAANLRDEKARLQESLNQKQSQFKQHAFKAWDEMAERARDAMSKEVPDWNQAAPKLAQWALEQGYPFEVITGYDRQTRERVGPGVVDPTFARTLYKAWKYDQLQAGKPAAQAKAAKAPPVVRPGAAGPTNTNAKQIQEARTRLKKSGSVSDAQALFKRFF